MNFYNFTGILTDALDGHGQGMLGWILGRASDRSLRIGGATLDQGMLGHLISGREIPLKILGLMIFWVRPSSLATHLLGGSPPMPSVPTLVGFPPLGRQATGDRPPPVGAVSSGLKSVYTL